MSVDDKGSKKRPDLKALAAAAGFDRTQDAGARPHRDAILSRLASAISDDPGLDLHDKLSELLDAARSITPGDGLAPAGSRAPSSDGTALPKFLSQALDDYIIAASAEAEVVANPATADRPAPARRSLGARIGDARRAISAVAIFCAFGASVGTLSALGVSLRPDVVAHAAAVAGRESRSPTLASSQVSPLRRFEFIAPERCGGAPCHKLAFPPPRQRAEQPLPAAEAASARASEPDMAARVAEPAAGLAQPSIPTVKLDAQSPPTVAVEDAVPNVQVTMVEPVLPAPEGFDALSAVILRGLPAGSTLSAGRRISETEWTLSAGDLKDVVITLPEDTPPRFRTTVELLRRAGQPAATLNIELRHAPGNRTAALGDIAKEVSKAELNASATEGEVEPQEAAPERETAKQKRKAVAAKRKHTADDARAAATPAKKSKRPVSRKVAARTPTPAAAARPKQEQQQQSSVAKAAPKPKAKYTAATTIEQPTNLDAGSQIQYSLGAPVWQSYGPPAPSESEAPMPTTLFGLFSPQPQQ